ncbi:MAG: divalent metal cation transporter [Candidatus Magasanikbacteria bacterium]|nr:divalent metal cation transporter [Candidatus Magasanikbacteria bacterium]
MSNKLKHHWPRLIAMAAVIGPGLITAVADNDAGGVATYTVAAAMYGMASQYLIVPTTLLLAVTQEIGARISIVTGKGLGGLIRERYGVKVAVAVFGFYLIVNQGVVLQNMSGLKAALQIFNIPWQWGLVATCLVLMAAIIKFNFRRLQRIFLVMILFYLTYVVSAFLVHPNWGEAVRESFVFPRKINVWDISYWFSLIAVLGTTITAWGQFFVSSFIVDKGLHATQLPEERVEIVGGAILTNFFSWMIALSVTATLFVNRLTVTSGYDAALAIRPLAGPFAGTLFASGLFGASLLGLTIVPLATAYVFTELFGYERTLNASFKKGRPFYIFFILQLVFALGAALFPQVNLFKLTLYADYLNGAMLPVIFYFLITFSESPQIMGEKHVVKGWMSVVVRVAAVLILFAVVVTFFGKILGWG